MDVDAFVTPGLGDSSYLVTSGDEAAVIDPQRDAGRFVDAARSRGARIRYVVETHVHNDYVSGAAEVRAATGAEIVGPAGAGFAFAYRPMDEGAGVEVGDASLVALAAPGHTFDHTAYLLRDGASQAAAGLFSGGSLIVGSAGRTDLLGADRTDELTRLQFRTMRRLAALPDDLALLPTHGAGSFCATTRPSRDRTSTIGAERGSNPALRATDESEFVEQQLSGLLRYPDYYAHMAPINRAGPDVFGDVPLPPPMSPDDVEVLIAGGGWIVDARDGASFAEAHAPGSLNVPLEESFASYVGWLLPFGATIALLVPDDASLVEASTQLFRIGFGPVEGRLEGGIEAWRASGRELASYPTVEIGNLMAELARGDAPDVVDVRQRSEWDAGHLDGSRHVFVADVPSRVREIDRGREVTVVCASGYRSAMAASLLHRAGVPIRLVPRRGVPWALHKLRSSA